MLQLRVTALEADLASEKTKYTNLDAEYRKIKQTCDKLREICTKVCVCICVDVQFACLHIHMDRERVVNMCVSLSVSIYASIE